MALLWENLSSQLDSVRASSGRGNAARSGGEESSEPRLQQALAAVKESGKSQMIESLKAALEGRQANLELPDLPVPGQTAMSGPEAYLAQISDQFKPRR